MQNKAVSQLNEPVQTQDAPDNTSFSYPRVIRSILLLTLAGVVFYAVATIAGDYSAISQALTGFPVQSLVLVLVLVLVGWFLRGWRFHYYLRSNHADVPFAYSLASFLAGFALTATPGKLGEAVKGVFLKRDYGVPVTQVMGIVMMERLMDLAGVLLLASFSVFLFKGWEHLFFLCAAAIVIGGAFLCMESLYKPVLERLAKLPVLSRICDKVLIILETGRSLMTIRIFIVGLIVSTISWGMESLSLYVILHGLQLESTLLEANFAYCISTLAGALTMLPGGVVTTEGTMVGVFHYMGITYSQGLPAVLLIRLCTLWFAVAVGAGFMALLMARNSRSKK
jgi:uncharacterized protein (TIRG00374 family)